MSPEYRHIVPVETDRPAKTWPAGTPIPDALTQLGYSEVARKLWLMLAAELEKIQPKDVTMSRLKYYRTYEEMKALALPFFEAVAKVLTGKRAEHIRQNIDQELLWEHNHDPVFGQDLGVNAWDLSVEFQSFTDTVRFIGSVHLGHGPAIVEAETPDDLAKELLPWLKDNPET